eukprot:2131737-Pleurochrysis_carterae.AAC.3
MLADLSSICKASSKDRCQTQKQQLCRLSPNKYDNLPNSYARNGLGDSTPLIMQIQSLTCARAALNQASNTNVFTESKSLNLRLVLAGAAACMIYEDCKCDMMLLWGNF